MTISDPLPIKSPLDQAPPVMIVPLVKPWWQSKSLWLGAGLTLLGASTYFADPIHTPTLTIASISEAVGGIAAIVLRVWFTSSAIAGTPASKPQLVEPLP